MSGRADLIARVVDMAIHPAMALLPRAMHTGLAKVHMVAIALQESQMIYRRQLGGGPARGLWQFEPGTAKSKGGVWGVYLHDASAIPLRDVCASRGVDANPGAIWAALERDDVLAAAVARLLLWTDRGSLPTTQAAAWKLYVKRLWRPGRPHPQTWAGCWRDAVDFGRAAGWIGKEVN